MLRRLPQPDGWLGAFLLLGLVIHLLLVYLLLVDIHRTTGLLVLHEDGYLLHFLTSARWHYHVTVSRRNETVALRKHQSRFSWRSSQILLVRVSARRLLELWIHPDRLHSVIRLWSLLSDELAHLHRVNQLLAAVCPTRGLLFLQSQIIIFVVGVLLLFVIHLWRISAVGGEDAHPSIGLNWPLRSVLNIDS